MYHFPRLADINGDGRLEIIYAKGCAEQVAYSLTGEQLWRYADEHPEAGYPVRPDSAVPCMDFNGDGLPELACFRRLAGVPHLCLVNARDGTLLRSTPIELHAWEPHASLIPVWLDGLDKPPGLLLHRDYWRIEAYGPDLQLRWTADVPELGHTTNAADIDGDGRDELFTGTRLFDADGRVLWSKPSLLDGTGESHPDSNRIADIDGDGLPELVVATGAQVLNRDGTVRWRRMDIVHHAQSVRLLRRADGRFNLCFTDLPCYETPARLEWRGRQIPDVTSECVILDPDGREVSRFPGVHTPQPGDWDGDGNDEIFVLSPDRRHIDVRRQNGALLERLPVQFKAYVSDMTAATIIPGARGCQLITHEWSDDEQTTWCVIHENLSPTAAPVAPLSAKELATYTCY